MTATNQQNDRWDAKLYDANHSFVHQLGKAVFELLAPQPSERILDLGCGTGPLTQQIAAAGATVVGIDASPAMIAQAKAQFPSLQFEVQDALTMNFTQPFDAIFSNAALHWMKPPEIVAARMFQSLKRGGRLVLEMGGQGNVAKISAAAIQAGRLLGLDLTPVVNINFFPTVVEYTNLLETQGFDVNFAAMYDRPTPLEGGAAGLRTWMKMFRPDAEKAVPTEQREVFFQMLENQCRPDLFREGVWYADYRRLRLTASRN